MKQLILSLCARQKIATRTSSLHGCRDPADRDVKVSHPCDLDPGFLPGRRANSKKYILINVLWGVVFLFAWGLQRQLVLNPDVSFLLLATEKLLAGGQYIRDFFTPNPPMIFFLYTPAVFVSHLFQINIIDVFNIYIFSLCLSSLLLCYYLDNKFYQQQSDFPLVTFLVITSIMLTILPLFEFGQRDHLFVVLILPYLLAVTLKLEGQKLSLKCSLATGLLAGLGFAIKPQFYITFLLVELFNLYHKKSCLRIETLLIISIQLMYLSTLFIYFPNYIFVVLPYLKQFYYQSAPVSFIDLLFDKSIALFCLATLFFIIQFKNPKLRTIKTILFLASIGSVGTYLLQKMHYFYHTIPPMSFCLLLLTLEASVYFHQTGYINKVQKQLHDMFGIIFITLAVLIFSYMQFELVENVINYKKNVLKPLISTIQHYATPPSILVISPKSLFGFSLINYSDAKMVQRYDALWILNFLAQNTAKPTQDLSSRILYQDLFDKKPQVVFVHTIEKDGINYLDSYLRNKQFSEQWQKNYQYINTLRFNGFNETLMVYERRNH